VEKAIEKSVVALLDGHIFPTQDVAELMGCEARG
jgi:hypothetical protein